MRFAAEPDGMGTSQALAGQGCVPPGSHPAAASPPRTKRPRRLPWRSGMILVALCGFLYAFSQMRDTGARFLWGKPRCQRRIRRPRLCRPGSKSPVPRRFSASRRRNLPGQAKRYVARRHRTGGGRQDILAYGGSDEQAPLLNLLIYQPGTEALPDSSFYVDLARRAAESGRAIIRAEQPVEMATRFGEFEVARFDLDRDKASPQGCFGFRFAAPKLRIVGFACGGEGFASAATSKAALTCLIDEIDLAPTVEDKTLIDFFAAHYALRSANCPGPAIDPAVPVHPAKPLKISEMPPSKRKERARKDNIRFI